MGSSFIIAIQYRFLYSFLKEIVLEVESIASHHVRCEILLCKDGNKATSVHSHHPPTLSLYFMPTRSITSFLQKRQRQCRVSSLTVVLLLLALFHVPCVKAFSLGWRRQPCGYSKSILLCPALCVGRG
jgi:hypothetical protein